MFFQIEMTPLALPSLFKTIFSRIHSFAVWLVLFLCFFIFLTLVTTQSSIDLLLKQHLSILSTSRNLPFGTLRQANLDKNEPLCSSSWTNGTSIQFIAFSVNNFSEVNFMMPGEFSEINKEKYKCLFHQNGNQTTMPVTNLGGSMVLGPSRRTFHLRCKIPKEIKESSHGYVKMILGKVSFNNFHNFTLLTLKIWGMVSDMKIIFVEIINRFPMINTIKTPVLSENIVCH